MIRIVVADDHRLFREGLVRLIASTPDMEVVGQASGGNEALNLVFEHRPDVLLLDISMPDMDGREVAERLDAFEAAPRIVFLTMHRDRPAFASALRHRLAVGYVLKDSAFEELVEAVQVVAKGGEFVSPSVTASSAGEVREPLTAREIEVLKLSSQGMTARSVARTLGVSVKTVENHRAHILRKLDAANMTEAVGIGGKNGYLG